MKRYLLLLLLLSFNYSSGLAQVFCGTDLLHRQRLREPAYARQVQHAARGWQSAQQLKKYQKIIISGKDTVYEIPVVVHVIHAGEKIGTTFNPSDGDIIDLMDYLNMVYNATWPLYPGTALGGVNIPIRFKLAQRDPDCNPTTGINRVDGSMLPGYKDYGVNYDNTTPAASDSAVKSLSNWPSGDYYNIWIVKYIDGPSGATAGAYAYYPFSTPLDGTVMAAIYTYPVFSGTYYSALPHELGHALWLMHTFEGDDGGTKCPDNTDCTIDGDGVCDTEPHIHISRCASGTNSCTGTSYHGVQYNIMNYSTCADRFTPEQKKRAMFALTNLRPGLVTSLGATAPDPAFVAPVPAACTPGILYKDNDTDAGPRQIRFADISPSSYGYTGDGYKTYLDRTCSQQTAHLQTGNAYALDVTTGPGLESVAAWIDYNNDGIFGTGELVMAHTGSMPDETHHAMVPVPATGITTGNTIRMRIIADLTGGTPLSDPCADLQYGQAEDYSILIEKSVSAGTDPELPLVSVSPNPSAGTVKINAVGAYHTELRSMEGKTLLRAGPLKEIDLGAFASGVYLLLLRDTWDGHVLQSIKLSRF